MSGTEGLPPGYDLVGPLGEGGFGEVVLARQRSLDRLVAIKRIHSFRLGDADSLERFRREGRLLASTRCPSVVRVYDLVMGAGGAHLVMEYVPGVALSDALADGPLPAPEALVVLRDVADALVAAAERGVVHRDIKPGNVFVLPNGHAKLGDFGQARIASDPSVFKTTAGQATGTPAYFPPEISKDGAEPDERSDAYSFAVMAYEILTGRRPFDAEDVMSLITAHWRLDPADPGDVVPGFPPAASRLLLLGLDKDPARRPLPAALVDQLEATPAHLWPAVHRASHGPLAGSRAPTTMQVPERTGDSGAPPTRSPGPKGQHPAAAPARTRRTVVLAGSAGLLLLVAVLGVTAFHHRGRPTPAGPTLQGVEVSTQPASGEVSCPGAVVVLTGVVHTNGDPGPLTLRWYRPDGGRTAPRRIVVRQGQREVRVSLRLELRGSRPMSGDAALVVTAPQPDRGRARVRYACPAG